MAKKLSTREYNQGYQAREGTIGGKKYLSVITPHGKQSTEIVTKRGTKYKKDSSQSTLNALKVYKTKKVGVSDPVKIKKMPKKK